MIRQTAPNISVTGSPSITITPDLIKYVYEHLETVAGSKNFSKIGPVTIEYDQEFGYILNYTNYTDTIDGGHVKAFISDEQIRSVGLVGNGELDHLALTVSLNLRADNVEPDDNEQLNLFDVMGNPESDPEPDIEVDKDNTTFTMYSPSDDLLTEKVPVEDDSESDDIEEEQEQEDSWEDWLESDTDDDGLTGDLIKDGLIRAGHVGKKRGRYVREDSVNHDSELGKAILEDKYNGMTNKHIQEKYNISNGQLYSYLFHANYPVKSKVLERIQDLGEHTIDTIVRAYEEGFPTRTILEEYDIKKHTLYTILDMFGVRKNK